MMPAVGSEQRGFSLLEVLVALTVAGLVLAAVVPASTRFYDSLERRAAIREVRSLLLAAREAALSSGQSQDVMVNPARRRVWTAKDELTLPESVQLTVHGAAQLNRDQVGVIRFYPDGSASGGGVDVRVPGGGQTRITVDWLIGRVELTQGDGGAS